MRAWLGLWLLAVVACSGGSVAGAPPLRAQARAGARTAAPTVTTRQVRSDQWYAGTRLHAIVSYPQVSGLGSSAVEQHVNALLHNWFPRGGLEQLVRRARYELASNEQMHVHGSGSVTLLRNGVLSVFYTGEQYVLRDGLMTQPQVATVQTAVTLDLHTGKAYPLETFFQGPRWRERLDHLLIARLQHGGGKPDLPLIRQVVHEHPYSCYLTPRGVTFFNLVAEASGKPTQPELSARELSPLLNPVGPVRVLAPLPVPE